MAFFDKTFYVANSHEIKVLKVEDFEVQMPDINESQISTISDLSSYNFKAIHGFYQKDASSLLVALETS